MQGKIDVSDIATVKTTRLVLKDLDFHVKKARK